MTTPRDSQRSKFLRAYYSAKEQHPSAFTTDKQRTHWEDKLKQKVREFGRGRWDYFQNTNDRWSLIYQLTTSSTPIDEAEHGRETARLMAQLVQTCIGREAAKALKDAYKAEGVKYRAAPKLTDEERRRRKDQGQALANRKADALVAEHREKIKQRLGIA